MLQRSKIKSKGEERERSTTVESFLSPPLSSAEVVGGDCFGLFVFPLLPLFPPILSHQDEAPVSEELMRE